jgi:Right handed beta helix region
MQRSGCKHQLRPLAIALSSPLLALNACGVDAASPALSISHAAFIVAANSLALNRQVTSCADDNSAGTLRSVITFAGNNDVIDLSTLPGADPSCTQSQIALSYEISIPANKKLTLKGPTSAVLAITSAGTHRIFDDASDLQIDDLTISGGKASDSGGCINSTAQVTLQHAVVTQCTVGVSVKYAFGAAVYANSVVLTKGSLITGNTATLNGATGLVAAAGGGVAAKTEMTCTDSSVSGNHADLGGGGIFGRMNTNVTLTNCTVDGNEGGGLYAFGSNGSVTILNSTISGNTSSRGAGIMSQPPVSIINSTIAFNASSGSYPGGVVAGHIEAESSIIAKNTSAATDRADLKSSDLIGSKNLIMSAYVNNPVGSGVITITTNPKLAPLANHGGPTRTHALLSTSPALNQGSNSQALDTDQRGVGFARMVGAIDIGAYERQVNDDELFYDGLEP